MKCRCLTVKIGNHNRRQQFGEQNTAKKPLQCWSSFWSLIIRPGRCSGVIYLLVVEYVNVCKSKNKHKVRTFAHVPFLQCTHLNMCRNVCGLAYMCVIMFTHLSLLLIYQCLTLCLSERRAKINVRGQASQICELSVSVV